MDPRAGYGCLLRPPVRRSIDNIKGVIAMSGALSPDVPGVIAGDGNLDFDFVEAYEHQVAHAQKSSRAGRNAKLGAVLAGLLGLFTGTIWTGDIAGAGLFSSTTIHIVAAVAAFLAAAVAVFAATFKWSDDQKNHAAAEEVWAAVKRDILAVKKSPHNAQAVSLLNQDRAAAREADRAADVGDCRAAELWIQRAAEGRQKEVNALKKLGVL